MDMERHSENSGMRQPADSLHDILQGMNSLNQRLATAASSLKFKDALSGSLNFDSEDVRESYQSEIQHIDSPEFNADVGQAYEEIVAAHKESLARLGLAVTLPERVQGNFKYGSVYVKDPDIFLQYLSFIGQETANRKDSQNVADVLEDQVIFLLEQSALDDEQYQDAVIDFLSALPKIIGKASTIERNVPSAEPERQHLAFSIGFMKKMLDASTQHYYDEFMEFSRNNNGLWREMNSFNFSKQVFLSSFQDKLNKDGRLVDDYGSDRVSILNAILEESRNNPKYAPVFKLVYQHITAVIEALKTHVPERLQGSVENFGFQIASVKNAFDQLHK